MLWLFILIGGWTAIVGAANETTISLASDTIPIGKEVIEPATGNGQQFARQSRAFEKRYRACPSLRNSLPNGWVKFRPYPNRARFYCNEGYDLIGNKYTTCNRYRWTHDLPVCVSSNCPLKINAQRPLLVKKVLNHGSVIDLSCELGYELSWSGTGQIARGGNIALVNSVLRLYCVDNQWLVDDWDSKFDSYNIIRRIPLHTLPHCEIRDTPLNRSMSCDFEESLCGWLQDYEDDFDWIRFRHAPPSRFDETGPAFDHTPSQNKSGYYLYLESSYPRAANDIARLYSPVYQHLDDASVACFQFYYHMYGKAIGSLRIYIKEKSQRLADLTPVWELEGDQGDQWLLGQVEIRPYSQWFTQPFQIIIEGVLGHGHQGDIAIDDLSLTLGKNCSAITNVTDVELITDGDLPASDQSSSSSTLLPNPQGLISDAANSNATMASSSPGFYVPIISNVDDNDTDVHRHTDQIIRSIFRMTVRNNSYTTESSLMGTSSTPAAVHHWPVPTMSPAAATTLNASAAGTTANYTWWKNLHQQMKEVFRKQEMMNKDLKNLTTAMATSTTKSSLPSSTLVIGTTPTSTPITTVSTTAISTEKPNIISQAAPLTERMLAAEKAPTEMAGKQPARQFAPHWTLMFGAFCLIAIITAFLYFGYANWPAADADHQRFAAIFVNRCKLFGGGGANGYDDSELLMVNNNSQNEQCYHNNDDDQPNSQTEGNVVFLQKPHNTCPADN